MPWPIKMREKRPENPQVGDMWPAPWLDDQPDKKSAWISPEFRRDHQGKRPPMVVVLPGYGEWCIDDKMSSTGSGWTVTGEPPNVTLSPSVNAVGAYHGWIQNGVISDDCEGRRF